MFTFVRYDITPGSSPPQLSSLGAPIARRSGGCWILPQGTSALPDRDRHHPGRQPEHRATEQYCPSDRYRDRAGRDPSPERNAGYVFDHAGPCGTKRGPHKWRASGRPAVCRRSVRGSDPQRVFRAGTGHRSGGPDRWRRRGRHRSDLDPRRRSRRRAAASKLLPSSKT